MTAVREEVVFFLNGQRCEVTGDDALLTVTEFLRERQRLVGTKIVCSEGDCGSCTVLIGRPDGYSLRYLPFDSCILFVFQLDGSHLISIEGLADAGKLTPVQQTMVDCHGSQCGFCTPGFIMAMTGLLEEHSSNPMSEDAWREGLTGNLCRCTGYSQILEACQQSTESDPARLEQRYPSKPIVESLAGLSEEPFEVRTGSDSPGRSVYSPVTLKDALRLRDEHPQAIVVAGATDLGVQRNKRRIHPQEFLDLNRVEELTQLSTKQGEGGSSLVVGARASWTDLLDWSRTELPEFAKIVSVFGSPQIRHAGTIGGNIINASPIADSLPLLHVLNAKLRLESTDGARTVDINDFYQGYKQFDLRPNELLTQVELPLPPSDALLKLYKVSRRRDLDISTFTAAILMRLDGETITEARIAYGAVGPIVLRLLKTEALLVGKPFTAETMRSAGDSAVDEISPISDVRGAADYRYQLARNALLKFHAEYEAEAIVDASS